MSKTVKVSNTADLRTAIEAGYTKDQIEVEQADHSAAVVQKQSGGFDILAGGPALPSHAQALTQENAARAGDTAVHGAAVKSVEREEAYLPRASLQAVATDV